ncbi:hypothetical protein A2U01_0062877, partial [Trifolium medium]|nr:hypothetical protein [Trifolium medium]
KDREAWKRECEKLTREPLKNAHDAIRLSCNYLNGVNEIVECKEKDGQILEPVSCKFFGGRDLTGTYANAFAQPQSFNLKTEQGWKFVRKERFNISGYVSSMFA